MGSCFSKKKDSSTSSVLVAAGSTSAAEAVDPNKCSNNGSHKVETEQKVKKKMVQEEEDVKREKEEESLVKEVFVIKHRKSHDRERDRRSQPQRNVEVVDGALASSTSSDENGNNICNANVANGCNGVVRTSSCTKEEVDAILIQCGRLSRSNSSGKTASSARKYSGSKRSYDFDHNDIENDPDLPGTADYDSKRRGNDSYCGDDEAADRRQHRQRSRQSGRPSPQGRRRTPSREREQQQQRSGSRERGSNSGGGRRVSRSPGRRSETTPNSTTSNASANATAGNNVNSSNRPGKMVSVPPTVSSLVMDKSNNGGNAANGGADIKRISVKRNVCDAAVAGSRSAASPRSQSPARTNANANAKGSNENQQQPSLSRSSSRKAEQSPYRRNPLSEIDPNSLAYPPSAGNKASCNTNNSRIQNRNKETEGQGTLKESTNVLNQKPNPEISNNRVIAQGTNYKTSSMAAPDKRAANVNCTAKEQQQIVGEARTELPSNANIAVTTIVGSGAEGLKPQTLTRSRSSRRSRDLDCNPEALSNPVSSYTTLLLEDIQNFHHKNTPSFSLPACLSKACSILEAVADLNSTTGSNPPSAFNEDRRSPTSDQYNRKEYNGSSGASLAGKKIPEAKDPFIESEILGRDELMEPSFHKYVTVKRGGTLGVEDMEEQESSGSNSFMSSGQQQWGISSSSWEPSSADSTDRWTSRSNTRERDLSPLGSYGHALSEQGHDVNDTRRALAKRDYDHQQNEIGRGRVGTSQGLHTIPSIVAAAST